MGTDFFHDPQGTRYLPSPNRDDDDELGTPSKIVDIAVAYFGLLAADIILRLAGFRFFHRTVRFWPTCSVASLDRAGVRRLCSAVDTAAMYYFKQALCLQRSAVIACLLRTRGVPAQLVIGCQNFPFLAHAWVEVHGDALDGEKRAESLYVLERC
jgi:transglutaminase superfamily protein